MNALSLRRLEQAHPLLKKLLIEAAKESPLQFEISEVARTRKRQEELFKVGATTILNSRHIPKLPKHDWYGKKPVSHAVDFYVKVGSKVRWDWPLYLKVADHIKKVAKELNIAIVWGGDWKKFKDGPHIELNRNTYP